MKYIFLFIFSICAFSAKAQKIESIHFHLYTDSLKKGVHNYINVDAKMSDGSWKPLTAKDLDFSSDYGKFEGNDLILPTNPLVEKVVISVTLKTNNQYAKQITIWIKQKPDPPLSGRKM